MENFIEIPDSKKKNYTTLNKDMGLVQSSNGSWDLWLENGDLVHATEFHSLQVGIIIACLTSWNYLNRYGNPTYEIFGNQSYTLLKENKSYMVKYKIEQYFRECLERMRRVYEVESLEVFDYEGQPNSFLVEFKVLSITNDLVDGSFVISTDSHKSSSFIHFSYNQPYASSESHLQVRLYLGSEYGQGLSNEIIYVYINNDFVGVTGPTNSFGVLEFEYYPQELVQVNNIHFEFHGNTLFNGCVSEYFEFISVPFYFHVDDDGLLYVIDSSGNAQDNIWIGEFVETVEGIEYSNDERNKLYLVPHNDNYISYKFNESYVLESFEEDIYILTGNNQNKPNNIQIGEIHLFIEGVDGRFYLLDDKLWYGVDE